MKKNEHQSAVDKSSQPDQRQLSAQREVTDAAARASFVGHGVSGGADIPGLRPNEVYGGVTIWPDGDPYHLILSLNETQVNDESEVDALLRAMGKEYDLPTYVELTILCKRMQDRFKPSLYFTGDVDTIDGVDVPALFNATPAGQPRAEDYEVWARAIRRVPANDEAVDFAAINSEQREITFDAARSIAGRGTASLAANVERLISPAQVAAIAIRLIDEAAREDDDSEPLTNEDFMLRAGIAKGICAMATDIQNALSSGKADGHA